jgi:uncharacterized iron-regulated protein
MKSLFLTTFILVLTGVAYGTSLAHTLRVADGSYVTLSELLDDIRDANMIFIGELHGHAGHHHAQLQIIRELHERGEPVAVAVEMFRRENQNILDRWVAGEISERQFLKVYNQDWGMWEYYQGIFVYARQNRIPMVAMNISREITQQVARQGFQSLSPRQLDDLPPIRCDVDPAYEEFIRRALGGHAHSDHNFKNFCEAQMVWDNVMAESILEFLGENPDYIVVVLAGSGHAWKHGIPEQVQRRQESTYRVLLPAIPGRLEPDNVTSDETDYLMIGLEEGPLH